MRTQRIRALRGQDLGTQVPTVKALTDLGYDRAVAKKLRQRYPQYAKQIVRLAELDTRVPRNAPGDRRYWQPGKKAHAPVTLYRGIDRASFDPSFDGYHAGQTFMTKKIGTALEYAWGYVEDNLWAGQRHGLVLEYQVPRFLLRKADRGPWPVFLNEQIPDKMAVVKRLGLVRYTKRAVRAQETDDVRYLTDPKRAAWQPATRHHRFIQREPGE